PEQGLYFDQAAWRFGGSSLDVLAFRRAWQEVVDQNSILRTGIFWEGLSEPLQVVHPRAELPWQELDWRGLPPTEQHTRLESFLQEDRSRGFELSRPPLMRVAVIRMGDSDYRIVWSFHHVLLDGWSTSLLLKDLFQRYEALVEGRQLHLPRRPAFREYIAWLQRQDSTEAQAWWTQALKGFTAPTPLPGARSVDRTGPESYSQHELTLALSEASTAAVRAFVRKHKLTINTVVQAAWALVLGCYSGESEVVFGSTVAGRPPDLRGGDEIIGMLINTLPVRVKLSAEERLLPWLQGLQAQQLEQRQYQHCPLVQLQKWSEIPREASLFDSLFVFGYPMDASVKERLGVVDAETFRAIERTNYPLNATLGFPRGNLELMLSHDSRVFDAAIIGQALSHWRVALESIVARPEQRVREVQLLTEVERRQLLVEWNDTRAEYPRETCVHQLFEAQAKRTPDAVAVLSGSEQLTYGELNRRANQLAHLLRRKGVGPETLVALSTERSVETVVGLLGILKAGGAYVPLDPAYPRERLAFMMEDTRARVLVTQSTLLGRLGEHAAEVLCLDTLQEALERESMESVASSVTARNLAYVIYTSGSTGRPKGAMIEHRGVSNYLTWSARAYGVEGGQGAPVHSSISFDLTVTSLILPLVAGRPVVMVAEEAGVEGLGEALRAGADFSLVKLTPTHLRVLSQQLRPEEARGRTRAFVIGGEGLTAESLTFWRTHAPRTRLINEYGPTETVVGCCVYEVAAGDAEVGSVPIGKPIANTQLYVLDRSLQLVPMGVRGELYIGGDGVGRGYLARPELTAERFIPDPFSAEPGARLYKTGDVVRRLPDGNLDFIGRLDTQVKVRGFRIELGEVEAVLAQHPVVSEAVAVVREDEPGNKQLVGYVVTPEGKDESRELRAFLKERLPEYMVPSALGCMEAFPVTQNGKVDLRALPAPNLGAKGTEDFVAPRGALEELVAGIWAQVLGLERVSADGNFFELGGHSLLVMQVLSRVRETFKVELPVRSLFGAPTVAGLARSIESALEGGPGRLAPPLVPVPREGELPASFAQQQLWFLEQLQPGGSTYNVPLGMHLLGRLDVAALERSLRELIRRHETLRTTFASPGGRVVQVISPEVRLELEVEDLEGLAAPEREAEARRRAREEAQRPFELSRGPLLRAKVLRLEREEHVLVLVMHHIVTDGWSNNVLLRELSELYPAYEAGGVPALPALALQYADYAVWQRQWLRGEVLEGQLSYWKKTLAGAPQALELPTDRARPQVQTFRGAQLQVQLPLTLSQEVRALSQREGATLFMTLLAALQALLARYSGQRDIVVGTPIAGRNRREVEGLIGFFVNTLALRADVQGALSFKELLAQVREACLGAYAHQELPFEQIVDALQLERDLSRTPLFQVMFLLENKSASTVELGGLSLKPLDVELVTAKFDLTVGLLETGQGMLGVWQYNTDLFDGETVARMAGHFQKLLEGWVARPEQRVEEMQLLTEAERRQLLVEWNDTREAFPLEQSIPELFEAQARRTPEAVAVSSGKGKRTYAELSREVARLAARLRERGVGTESVVALLMDRSLEFLTSVLAVFKAGGAYLPLDAEHPPQRIARILERSGAVGVLVSEARREGLANALALLEPGVRPAEWSVEALLQQDGPVAELPAPRPEQLAYVIYTSGSTGMPKGAMLEHRGMLNHLFAKVEELRLTSADVVAQTASQCFDISVWQFLAALLVGGQVHIVEDEVAHEPRPL
ncbi:non-ribosomal peptide synthetase, partial [Archangium sp.]|uniref:non-ribosomal peptide synthetase n=1 Tax=Archangium sp. TaxID=1872627 RepID=UPI002D5C70D2